MVLAILAAEPVKTPDGGWVESVVTLDTHLPVRFRVRCVVDVDIRFFSFGSTLLAHAIFPILSYQRRAWAAIRRVRRRNLGTFRSRAAAEKHERAVQFFKRQH